MRNGVAKLILAYISIFTIAMLFVDLSYGADESFVVQNHEGKPVIYITSDPSVNWLKLTVTNLTDHDLQLKGGIPVPEDQITDNSPSSLYFTLGDLLEPEHFGELKIAADGWNAKYFEVPVTNWALTPKEDMTLASNDSVSFTVTNILASDRPRIGYLTIDYYSIPSVENDSRQLPLFLQNPPSPELKELNLDYNFVGGKAAYVTKDNTNPITNTLVFFLSNPSPDRPLVPLDVLWETDPPVFYVWFVYGEKPGYGALCTAERAAKIELSIAEKYGNTWKYSKKIQGGNPYWELDPQEHEILGIGEGSTVQFSFSNIITELEPGVTHMYVQYANIPGYNDGYLSLEVEKDLPVPGILRFLPLTPDIIQPLDPVTLCWGTFAIQRLELSYNDVRLSSERGEIKLNEGDFEMPKPPLKSTTYYLDAYNSMGEKCDFRFIPITVLAPEITGFEGPENVVYGQKVAGIKLKWETEYADRCELWADGELVDKNAPANSLESGYEVEASRNTTYKLSAYYRDVASLPHTIYCYVKLFRVKGSVSVQNAPTDLAVNPHNGSVYVANSGSNNVSVIETANNRVVSTVDVMQIPYALAINPQGAFVYVVNESGNSNSVSVIDTRNNSVVSQVCVGHYPFTLAVSPGGEEVYVANSVTNNISVIQTASHKVIATVNVGTATMSGKKPCALTYVINPSGDKRVWVANRDSDSVSVIDTTKHSVVGILKVGTSPYALAGSPDGKWVYVVNRDSNNVSVIETDKLKVVKTVCVGKSPCAMAIDPDGMRVYVANRDSDNVSVIETTSHKVVSTVPVGTSPLDVAIANHPDDDKQDGDTWVYVANSGSNTVSVIETVQDKVVTTLAVGEHPLALAINQDGTWVYVANYRGNTVSVIEVKY